MSWFDFLQAIGFVGGLIIYLYYEFKKRRRKLRQNVDNVVALNDRLYPILWQLLVEYRAIRVSIMQFHNGEVYYTGQSIQRNTMTHEVCGPDIAPVKPQFDNRLTSNVIHHVIKMTRDTGHWGFASLDQFQLNMQRDNDEADFRLECRQYNIRSAQWFRITDKNNNVTGLMSIHWNLIQPLDVLAIKNIIHDVNVLENIFEESRP